MKQGTPDVQSEESEFEKEMKRRIETIRSLYKEISDEKYHKSKKKKPALDEYSARVKDHILKRKPIIKLFEASLQQAMKTTQEVDKLTSSISQKRTEKERYVNSISNINNVVEARKKAMDLIRTSLRNNDQDLGDNIINFIKSLNEEHKKLGISTMVAIPNFAGMLPSDIKKNAEAYIKQYDVPTKKSFLKKVQGIFQPKLSHFELLANAYKSQTGIIQLQIKGSDEEIKKLNDKRTVEVASLKRNLSAVIKTHEKYENILSKDRNEAAVIMGEAREKFKGVNKEELLGERATAKLAELEILETEQIWQQSGLARRKINTILKDVSNFEKTNDILNTLVSVSNHFITQKHNNEKALSSQVAKDSKSFSSSAKPQPLLSAAPQASQAFDGQGINSLNVKSEIPSFEYFHEQLKTETERQPEDPALAEQVFDSFSSPASEYGDPIIMPEGVQPTILPENVILDARPLPAASAIQPEPSIPEAPTIPVASVAPPVPPIPDEPPLPKTASIPEAPPIPAVPPIAAARSAPPPAPPIPGASLTSKDLDSFSEQGHSMSPMQLGPQGGGIQSEPPVVLINLSPPAETSKQDFTFQKPEGINALFASIAEKPGLKKVSDDIKRDFSAPKLPDDGELRAPTASDNPIKAALLAGLARVREVAKGENGAEDLVKSVQKSQSLRGSASSPSSPTPVTKKFSPPTKKPDAGREQ